MRCSALPFFASLASAAVRTIQVGSEGLSFTPQTVTANEGDTIIFELHPTHDVVEGDGFDNPAKASDDGFYSGPYSGSDEGKKKFVVNVTSDDPIYFYCSLSGHWRGGMVGGINVPSSGSKSIDEYAKAAQSVSQAQTPSQVRGGQLLDEAQISTLTGSASATASGSGSGSASSAQVTGTPSAFSSRSPSASASASASAESTAGAAQTTIDQINGAAAVVLGIAAWFV